MTEGMNHRIDANIIGSSVNEPFRTNCFIGPTDSARSWLTDDVVNSRRISRQQEATT